MFNLTEIVKDGILEIRFSDDDSLDKSYRITCSLGKIHMQGNIAGSTQRTCLYIGEFKKGKYHFILGEDTSKEFIVA